MVACFLRTLHFFAPSSLESTLAFFSHCVVALSSLNGYTPLRLRFTVRSSFATRCYTLCRHSFRFSFFVSFVRSSLCIVRN
ncbi:hypothetical protein [Pectobacterium phage Clickz_B7]|uniref:Uncharacterized protein n=1 Tax=Pectobacterium phage Clickz_B7 TaxID=2489624 RepID=A0A3G8FHX2_9CAUD|nr:hypothetical protein [Pectobacterium phage Clickz_B7]